MSAFATQATVTKWLPAFACAGVLALLIWPAGLQVAIALEQEKDEPTHAAAQPPSETIAIDEEQYELQIPAKDEDTPGILKYAGYAEQVIVRQGTYRSKTGGATVEVIEHPSSYPYVKHDVLGAFFHAFQEQKKKVGRDAGEIVVPIEYVEWQTAEPQKALVICVLCIRLNGASHGIAGWYAEADGRTTTVMLRFGAPAGLPRAVIDEYLKKYPSTIEGTVPSLESWEADDIAKWSALLQSRGNEDAILSTASKHLRRYDPGAFGLMEAWSKRSDPAVLADAIDKSIQRMNTWLDDQEKSKKRKVP